ncbi:hypothetical protein ERICI_01008 [Paenibacillus larvae subsp. larvae]|nr:hypothetical protein ERICI_01008 [Paenibacillus larvae subsp. larvae]AVG13560.1 hypothetical protein ERICII_03246 [Paenibacillus larvae subsp. larvae DSM 25430]ETK28116.1 hypothetical protein ERIC1_1c15740 [Paenibacillus larvae subsp. larvae DSM 25719]
MNLRDEMGGEKTLAALLEPMKHVYLNERGIVDPTVRQAC